VIVVDASALVAVLLSEVEQRPFLDALASQSAILSPVGYWEAHTRLHGLRGTDGVADLDALLANFDIQIAPATEATSKLATQAQVKFGKRTPTKLNLGDCFAYALARERRLPLLYKGDDFIHTDIVPALTA
jgi:ribonuclease VapC